MTIPMFLCVRQVAAIIGLSRSTIYRGIQAGTFPKPLKPTGTSKTCAARWPETVIAHWVETQIAKGEYGGITMASAPQEFRTAEEIITRLAHRIEEEERRVVRREGSE